jgi:hypothetical protein
MADSTVFFTNYTERKKSFSMSIVVPLSSRNACTTALHCTVLSNAIFFYFITLTIYKITYSIFTIFTNTRS